MPSDSPRPGLRQALCAILGVRVELSHTLHFSVPAKSKELVHTVFQSSCQYLGLDIIRNGTHKATGRMPTNLSPLFPKATRAVSPFCSAAPAQMPPRGTELSPKEARLHGGCGSRLALALWGHLWL